MIAVIRESIFTYSISTEEHALAVKDTQVGCGDDHSKKLLDNLLRSAMKALEAGMPEKMSTG